MRRSIHKSLLCCALAGAMFSFPVQAADQEIPRRPAETKQPTAETSFSNIFKQRELPGSNNACVEWTDGCRACRRNGPDTFSCSNVGIACVQTTGRCTRSNPQ